MFWMVMALVLILPSTEYPHVTKYKVLVDTDAALDDLRALAMLVSMPECEIIGITVSGGSCSPEAGLRKVRALLVYLNKEDTPSASGPEITGEPPAWREFCENAEWSGEDKISRQGGERAAALIVRLVKSSDDKVIFVCLGPLTNLAGALREDPAMAEHIDRIIWYNDEISPPRGTNYELDAESADYILGSKIPIHVLSDSIQSAPCFNLEFLSAMIRLRSPAARMILFAHTRSVVLDRVSGGHLKLWDDLVPVYLRCPELFMMEKTSEQPLRLICRGSDAGAVKNEILRILQGPEQAGPSMRVTLNNGTADVLADFPQDLRLLAQEIVARHGAEEWRLCLLTTELHRHLGIYSIVGAKMGLRAREVLGAGPDELTVVSFAGSVPPVSCLNDGLQVSTGATLGQGTISIAEDGEVQPAAAFTRGEKTVRLTLKPQCWEQIREDIASGVREYGDLTPDYFAYVRKLAIRYWLEWSREEIFDIAVVD
jgi:pyrimidine-specific ribonucleoside hydrolase